MNRWAQAGFAVLMMSSPAACMQQEDDEPKWRPATESVVYEVCVHDFANQPCVLRKTGEEQSYLYRAGRKPTPVELLWVEDDGRWRVVVE